MLENDLQSCITIKLHDTIYIYICVCVCVRYMYKEMCIFVLLCPIVSFEFCSIVLCSCCHVCVYVS